MKILIGNNGNVDFDGPVEMNQDQREEFINLMNSLFKVVQIKKADQIRFDRIGDKLFMKPWEKEEYAVLLEIEDTNNVSEMLGRTWMSVDIKRGDFFPKFMLWVEMKGKSLLKDNIQDLIEDFMKEKEQELLNKNIQRKNITKNEKEIKRLEELITEKKTKRRKQLEILKINDKELDIDTIVSDEIKELENKIEQIKLELESLS